MPKAFRRHRSCLLSFFKILFSTFSVKRMLNINGACVAALKKVLKFKSRGAPYKFLKDSNSN
ncbi:uncharacterized protein K441DRAFT_670440 [Cenococcum geophilum 1.58]|uniref:Uncharacterized protein n=1 Tax=Cenococcum geophilum 1.58 TaxID=794803 RepID=A0ACC8ENK6_9PEZI|nr:hypothetical protein K441DRAFT_670440 [Cenococcum geophilum 1.58]